MQQTEFFTRTKKFLFNFLNHLSNCRYMRMELIKNSYEFFKATVLPAILKNNFYYSDFAKFFIFNRAKPIEKPCGTIVKVKFIFYLWCLLSA